MLESTPLLWGYTCNNVTETSRHLLSFKKSSPEKWIIYTYINVRSRGKQFCFPENQTSGLEENKINWFPKGPDIKCFVIFLDFHFSSNKRITGANQNSRLGTYNNTNLILKTTEWMIYKVPSLYYLHHFPPLAAVFLLGTSWITFKIVAF